MQLYGNLQGLDSNGDQLIDPSNGEITTFMNSGDPISNTGWLDFYYSPHPGDVYFMQASGSFDMAPGDTQRVIYAIIIGHDNNRFSSILDLRKNASFVYTSFYNEFSVKATAETEVHIISEEEIELAVFSAVNSSLGATSMKAELFDYEDNLIQIIDLFDDGQNTDVAAGDNIFTGSWQTTVRDEVLYLNLKFVDETLNEHVFKYADYNITLSDKIEFNSLVVADDNIAAAESLHHLGHFILAGFLFARSADDRFNVVGGKRLAIEIVDLVVAVDIVNAFDAEDGSLNSNPDVAGLHHQGGDLHFRGHAIRDYRARILFGGSATDETDFVGAIESIGGLVVADSLCYGSRAFWNREPKTDGDPFKVLAKMFLENLLCPRMFEEYHARRDFVLAAVERARVDGVILAHNKFCDVHGIDNVALRIDIEKKGIPVLQLEKEYGAAADLGRMKTRVQAFLERIGDRR